MAKKTDKATGTGSSTTKEKTNGQVLELEAGDDSNYLCAHICYVKKFPIKGKVGQFLYQRACTYAIWKQEEAFKLIWKYKAEVGYRMRDRIPTPIMSEEQINRASRFPLGVAAREGMFALKDLETSAKGRLRIPDVIILKVTEQELISMWMASKPDWSKLIPVQKNIEKVVEIKFGKDILSQSQQRAYIRIAGSPSKFKLLEDKDCYCEFRDDENNSPNATIGVGVQHTYSMNPFVTITRRAQQGLLTPSTKPVPIGTFLDNAPLTELALGAGFVVIVVGAIVLLPATATVAGAGVLGGYVLATS